MTPGTQMSQIGLDPDCYKQEQNVSQLMHGVYQLDIKNIIF